MNIPFDNDTIKEIAEEKINNILVPKQYQLDAVDKLKNAQKSILSLPCGMGKTFTASLLTKG